MARVMEIKTPLGDGALLFYSMAASEALGRLFEYELTLLSPKSDIKPEDLLGKSVTVKLELPDGSDRFFDACVTRFGLTGGIGRYFRYQLTGRPWAWLMTRTADCRIFQNKSVPDIVKEIFSKYKTAKFDDRLTGEYLPWEYCVQYRETDFNFVSRLLEQEGIYYFFKHEDGKHTMVLADSNAAHEAVSGFEQYTFLPQAVDTPRRKDEVIEEWFAIKQVQPGAYVYDDYDFERPSVELEATFKDAREHAEATGEVYDFPGEYIDKAEGEHFVQTRLQELLAQYEVCEGSGTTQSMCTGSLFKLVRHPRSDQNREYLVTSAQYRLQFEGYEGLDDTGGDYRCSFTAMPSAVPFRPARSTPKPIVQGPQTAVVVGPAGDEIHTDKYGRVKVHFHWDRYGKRDENDTTWIRVSHPWAGKGWGSVSIPRIGQEVIVDFLEGDPDQPIITGRVYNAETMPPFGLPGAGVISGIKSSTHKGRGYNEMTMDDTAGKEKITIHGQYDMSTTVLHDQSTTVKNNRTDNVSVDDSETVGNNQTQTVGVNQTIKVGADRKKTVGGSETVSVAVNRKETVGGTETITITGHRTETVNGGETVTVTGGRSHTVNGVQTTTVSLAEVHSVGAGRMHNVGAAEAVTVGGAQMVNVGGAQMVSVGAVQRINVGGLQSIGVGGAHKLSAAVINQTSKGVFQVKAAGTAMVEAPTIVLKAGGSKIVMNSSGVTIKAAKVTIKASGKVSLDGSGGVTVKGANVGEN